MAGFNNVVGWFAVPARLYCVMVIVLQGRASRRVPTLKLYDEALEARSCIEII